MRSIVWQYFQRLGDYTAQCVFCKSPFSYRSSVSNLKKHYDRTHKKDYGDLENITIENGNIIKNNSLEETENEINYGQKRDNVNSIPTKRTKLTRLKSLEDFLDIKETSDISTRPVSDSEDEDLEEDDGAFWNFIEYSKGKHYCSTCKKPLSRRATELKRHISRYHPELISNLKKSPDNEAADKDLETLTEDLFTEVIYLDDHEQTTDNNGAIGNRNFSRPKKAYKYVKTKPKPYDRIIKLERTTSDTSDLLTRTDNNLENFTTYILSLLRALPQHVTNKLQLDIINLILKAKMEHEDPIMCLPIDVSVPTAGVSYETVNDASKHPDSPSLMINLAAETEAEHIDKDIENSSVVK